MSTRWPIALCLALTLVTPAAARAADTVDLVVRRDAGLTAAERADVRADAGVTHERNLRLPDTEVVSVPAAEAAAALGELRADPDVRWAQRDAGVQMQAVRNADTSWSSLWGLENTGQWIVNQNGIADADMDGPEAWTSSTGAGVTVAVVDTGVSATHEDLAGQLATNPGEQGAGRETNGVDDDHDDLVDNWRGWDFTYDDNDPSDVQAHGSHVAGTIAAVNANGKGISGLAPDAKILPLKALNDTGNGSWSDLADAFDYAGAKGIRVVNASLGAQAYVPLIDDVVARWPNTLYVVSAGNDNANMDSTTYYPCESTANNVLCVGASDNRDERAYFSNYSPTAVDVFAPGVSVLSSYVASACGGLYCFYNGTSMASPHVAAEAALIVARNPTLNAAQLKQAIIDSAEPKGQLTAYGRNGGRANARAALDLVQPPSDGDSDGVADQLDNCPNTANAGQQDGDGDGAGDACDAQPAHDDRDPDFDGVANADDNCPNTSNHDQGDVDNDGVGNVCDTTPRGPDSDFDGVPNMDDNCAGAFNPSQLDSDSDGVGDECDLAAPPVSTPTPTPTPPTPVEPVAPIAPPVTPAPPVVAPAPTLATPKVTATRCGKKACLRTLTITAQAANASSATVALTRQACPKANCAYTSAATRRTAVAGGALALTLKVKLAAGRFRLTVTVNGPGGTTQRVVTGTVR